MDIDAAGETQEYQRQQEGNAHVIDPLVAEKQHVSESVPFHGRYVPLLWQVPGEPITTGWGSLMADHRSLTQSLRPHPGEPIPDVDTAQFGRSGGAAAGVTWCSPASIAASARTYAACVMTIRNLATIQAEQ
jgi:hypothetical protein